jgi:SAM-dependent methyltransferase
VIPDEEPAIPPPAAPSAPQPPRAPPLPPRARAASTVDVDIQVDVEPATPSEPAISSEPSEASEISPEDVVSVEAVASSRSPSAPPPPMRPRAASSPSFPPVKPTGRSSVPNLSTATIRTTVQPEHTAPPPPPKPKPIIVPSASPLAPPPMTDAAMGRKRARPWWEELFNDDFIRTMAKISDRQIAREVDFIEESLGLDKGAMVLDLACGTGRHAIELSRRGYQVVGFDLSLAMLAKAADEAQDRGQKLNFVQGDMREMTFDGTFDGVYCWSTSFGYFEEEKNGAVIENVRRALKPGGQLLLDIENRDFVAGQCPSMAWFEGDGCVCMDDMNIDWITSRMRVKRTMMMDDGRSREIEYSIRLYALHELGKLLHEHGFRVAEVSGRTATPGVFLGADSPRTLILAEKK